MSIRILQVVTSMEAGGIETMLMNIYRQLDRDKIQFDFLVHREFKGFYEDEITELGGKIYHIIPITPLKIREYKLVLLNFYNEHTEYKIIHSHISVLSYFVLNVAKINNIPIRIAHSHEAHKNIWSHRFWRIPFIIFLKFLINKQITHRFACSEEAGQWLFGEKSNYTVIKNAIDSKRFIYNLETSVKIKNELHISDRFVIGHIGNFSKAKNYPFLLNIFKTIHDKNNAAVLLLIGKNNNIPELEKRISDLGLTENVIFTGVRSDIPELLQAMDVLVFPSLFEGLGIVLIEAQAAGLKCFASADVVPEEAQVNNLLEYIPLSQAPKKWADNILQYQNGYERTNRYDDIVKAGYDIHESAHLLQEFYLNVLNENINQMKSK